MDSFELIRDIYKVDDREFKKNLNELKELLDIGEIIRTPARQLSLGQRMRCEIAASLLHSPSILFLDEPTIGLDAVSKVAVRKFIRTVNSERKTTVILTTHDMQDIEALTERILLIGRGKILLDGSLSELKRRNFNSKTFVVDYAGTIDEIGNGMSFIKKLDGHAEILIDTDVISVSEAIAKISAQVDIRDISVTGTTAEEMVVSLYREFKI